MKKCFCALVALIVGFAFLPGCEQPTKEKRKESIKTEEGMTKEKIEVEREYPANQ